MGAPGKSETAANAAIVVAAAILCVVLVKVYLLPQPARATVAGASFPQIATGADLRSALPGVDWRKDGRTLVLGVSTQCHFCTASAPFLRQIAASAGKEGVKIVAVFPQPVAEAQKYLAGEGVRVDQVMQLPLTRIGVRGTPTMILANGKGVVTNVWVGEQSPAEQPAVLRILTDAPAPVAAHR